MNVVRTLRFIANHPLNRNNKTRSLIGFLKWQIGSRLVPGQVVCDWVNGSRMIVGRGESGLTGNVYCGLHEFADMGYVLHVLDENDLFVDVGANVGSYTILACAARGAHGYSFEPVPSTYRRLMDNIQVNDLTERVTCLNVGVADSEGVLRFTSGKNTTNHVISQDEVVSGVIEVKVVPLDSVLSAESPTVAKIDVEGFETPVLHGARDVLRNEALHSVVMELNGSGERYGFDEGAIVRMMAQLGFEPFRYDPFDRVLTRIDGKNETSGNTLFIRDVDRVRDRLRSAPHFSVRGESV